MDLYRGARTAACTCKHTRKNKYLQKFQVRFKNLTLEVNKKQLKVAI